MATGVLPVFVGRATVLSSYLLEADKSYLACIKLGTTTDTYDITGKITSENEVKVTNRDLDEILTTFIGEQNQIPPMFSALKKDGVRLYELARRGEEVERELRKCEIYKLEIGEEQGEFTLYCECSAGTYIRSLISDMGAAVGTGAVMTSLQRTYACGVSLEDCFTLEELDALAQSGDISKVIIPVDKLLSEYPELHVTDNQAIRFKNGGDLMAQRLRQLKGAGLYRVYGNNEFLGLGEYIDGAESLTVKRVYVER
jgi:tRNA pseudouridine55 synthase